MFSTAMRGNTCESSSTEQSLDRESESDDVEEEDDVSKEKQNVHLFSAGQQNIQNGIPNMVPRSEENLPQAPQLELVGHSIACASNPYYDPYYGGMMAAYGQPLVHPQFLDLQQARMPLPLEMAQEPVYVNSKQYRAILRRRQSRAKAELEKKLIKDRKPYLHESRHQHAMRRVRGSGGRFAKKTEVEASNPDKKSGSPISSQTTNSSSGLKRLRSESTESFNTCQETRMGGSGNSCNARGDGGSFGQQWGSLPSNQASQRAVAMK